MVLSDDGKNLGLEKVTESKKNLLPCVVCNKEGWTPAEDCENGETVDRLFLLIDGRTVCEACLHKESEECTGSV